jgi:hypothetical protein
LVRAEPPAPQLQVGALKTGQEDVASVSQVVGDVRQVRAGPEGRFVRDDQPQRRVRPREPAEHLLVVERLDGTRADQGLHLEPAQRLDIQIDPPDQLAGVQVIGVLHLVILEVQYRPLVGPPDPGRDIGLQGQGGRTLITPLEAVRHVLAEQLPESRGCPGEDLGVRFGAPEERFEGAEFVTPLRGDSPRQ